MHLIGLSGYARAGKNQIADILSDTHYFRTLAFADRLRKFLYVLNPLVEADEPMRLQEIIDKHGWDGYKSTPYGDDIRILLQRLGTECGRGMIGEDVWVNMTFRNLQSDSRYVVTDCRFPNEALAIVDYGGVVWRVNRPGIEPVNNHKSETALDNWDFDAVIDNDGGINDLRKKISDAYMAITFTTKANWDNPKT